MARKIHGVIPPIVTPFNSTHQIDKDRLRDLTSYLLDAGVDGMVACGSTGEFPLMSLEERKIVTEIVAEVVDGKVPVIEGVTAVRTEDAGRTCSPRKGSPSRHNIAAPSYYYKLDEKEFRGYYADLAKVDLPIIIYNIPLTTKTDMSPEFLVGLATEFENIDYVKESTADRHRVSEIQRLTNKIEVVCGWDPLIYDFLTHEVKRWISTVSNVIPKQCADLVRLVVERNEQEKARKLFYSLLPTIKLIDGSKFVQYAKAGLNILGHECGPTRNPLQPLTEPELDQLRKTLNSLGMS